MSMLRRRVRVYNHVLCTWEWIWITGKIGAFTGIGLCAAVLIHGGGHGWFPAMTPGPSVTYPTPRGGDWPGLAGWTPPLVPIAGAAPGASAPGAVVAVPDHSNLAIPALLVTIMLALGLRRRR